MNITEVRLTILDNSKALAIGSITIDSDFVVGGLTVYNGQNGLWVSMPSRKNKDNEYKDIAYPITKSAREQIQSSVLNKYHELTQSQAPYVQPPRPNESNQTRPIDDDLGDMLPF